jgi:UDP-glucuronate 4-epimerase
MKILVTGVAGFIGCFTAIALLKEGHIVVGIDNLNDYYDVGLKMDRLGLIPSKGFKFTKCDLVNYQLIDSIFLEEQFDVVINLAAQAGVRYSIENPRTYIDSNVVGFVNILEACRHNAVGNLIYASSSSVYGSNTKIPFSVKDAVNHPVSLYAATKKANELMAHSYSHLYQLPTTGLRFFTVYGPWGRPDMAYFSFVKNILAGESISVFNHGDMYRDFTYIDDIVNGVVSLVEIPAGRDLDWNSNSPDPSSSSAPFRVYNIGNNKPVKLTKFIETIEEVLGVRAHKNYLPMQMGDVESTFADIEELAQLVGYEPKTDIEHGVAEFVSWYHDYYVAQC